MPLCTVLVVLAGLPPVAWLVASEFSPSQLGQWAAGIGGLICFVAGMFVACWRPKPPRGFPIQLKHPNAGA
jgi:hypothetical protein